MNTQIFIFLKCSSGTIIIKLQKFWNEGDSEKNGNNIVEILKGANDVGQNKAYRTVNERNCAGEFAFMPSRIRARFETCFYFRRTVRTKRYIYIYIWKGSVTSLRDTFRGGAAVKQFPSLAKICDAATIVQASHVSSVNAVRRLQFSRASETAAHTSLFAVITRNQLQLPVRKNPAFSQSSFCAL